MEQFRDSIPFSMNCEEILKRLCKIILIQCQQRHDLLPKMKHEFSDRIESNRKLEKVKNIEDLFAIIIRKSLWPTSSSNQEQMESLKIFSEKISNNEFSQLLAIYQRLMLESTQDVRNNKYADRRRSKQISDEQISSAPSAVDSSENERRKRIFRVIANNLSIKDEFKKITRYLMFPDNQIDEILIRHQDSRANIIIFLDQYERQYKSYDMLLKALRWVKRNDIVNEINKIITSQ